MGNDLNSSNLKEFWQSKHFAGTHINPFNPHIHINHFLPISVRYKEFLFAHLIGSSMCLPSHSSITFINHTSSKPKQINKIFNSVVPPARIYSHPG